MGVRRVHFAALPEKAVKDTATAQDDPEPKSVSTENTSNDSDPSKKEGASEGNKTDNKPAEHAGYVFGEFERKWKDFQQRYDDVLKGMLLGAAKAAKSDSSVQAMFKEALNKRTEPLLTLEEQDAVLGGPGQVTLEEVASRLKIGNYQNVIVMAGAGISVSAGIPDFRSPETGLYAKLSKDHNISSPQTLFDIEHFKKDPGLFYSLRKEIFKDGYQPTLAHYFVKLLWRKGILLRLYTQNIDGLESVAGIPQHKVVNAHGTMSTSRCSDCSFECCTDDIRDKIMAGEVPKCSKCGGVIRPNIVMFGESLSDHFVEKKKEDFPQCDLLIIMGTSLTVHPFAGLVNEVPETAPRVLINKDSVGTNNLWHEMGEENYRDIWCQGTCDDGCRDFAKLLQWEGDLDRVARGEDLLVEHEGVGNRELSEAKTTKINRQQGTALPAAKARQTAKPSSKPSLARPTAKPSSTKPTAKPAAKPTAKPSSTKPTAKPSSTKPTAKPAAKPSSSKPAAKPSSSKPAAKPTAAVAKPKSKAKPRVGIKS